MYFLIFNNGEFNMFYDLYNTVYFVTVGAWLTCYQHLTGTYQKGGSIGSGLGDSLTIVFSYMCVSIEILLGTVGWLSV
jgi:hypothetical protein